MTSLKTGYLLFLAAVLFLSIVPTLAKVVNSVGTCRGFLLQESPPQLPGILESGKIKDQNRYKPICQTYKDKTRFLTLYDITNKIPVFSAYKYVEIKDKGRPKDYWKIEPEIEDKTTPNRNMEDEGKDQICINQATSKDYESNIYDKGHLNPSAHGSTEDDKESTMTLTNIVPQDKDFNQKRWRKMEDCVTCVMDKFCKDNNDKIEGFVVTGAQPGTEKLNNKVNIPSIVWSAFCCYNAGRNMWIASAHWDNNYGAGDDLKSQTLTDLYNTLKVGTNLFRGSQCPLGKNLGAYQEPNILETCKKNCK